MATVCISNSAKHAGGGSFPTRRAKYVNLLYQWPESDAEFVKPTAGSDDGGEGQFYFLHPPPPRVVDSVSCRQLYLRSAYTFSRKESVPERTKKCFERVKERVAIVAATRKFQSAGSRSRRGRRRRRRLVMVKRVKEFSREAFRSIFQRLLSCTASVDVVERN